MLQSPALVIVLVCAVTVIPACELGPSDGVGADVDDQVILDAADNFPCVIEFEGPFVVLKSDAAGSVPDPGGVVVRGPDGRFFTSTPYGGEIVVWSENGGFLQTVGRPGPGPGELGSGAYPMVDESGTIHVIDRGQGRWNRFTAEGQFIGSGSSALFRMASVTGSAVIGSDSFFTSMATPPMRNQFHIVNGKGDVVKAFGPLPDFNRGGASLRATAVTSQRTFWAGPPHGTPEYVLEEWGFDGALVRRIIREVPWFSRIVRRELPTAPDGSREPLPIIIRPFAGPSGLLVVMITSFGFNEPVNAWFEVIDPDRQAVLASRHMPGVPLAVLDVERESPWARRYVQDEAGLVSSELYRFALRPTNGRDSSSCVNSGPPNL
jgi:hypothetical protein